MATFRTDRHNNPTAFTVDLAKQAKLEPGVDYIPGDQFVGGVTARILGDAVEVTSKLIDAVGFLTKAGSPRWAYITMPKFVWDALNADTRRRLIGWMYRHEGGTAMNHMFGVQ